MYLEMSRDDLHGGGSWRFPLCIWAPTERQGGGNWPFWSKVREIKAGDTILHLRGISPKAAFVGYSTASSDGFEARQGQAAFARELKKLYGSACCFPSCSVADSRFLVASHIARWSDNEKLRGHLGNGLCLCLMHDRAFEIGLFTLDDDSKVFVNLPAIAETPFGIELRSAHGIPIRRSTVALLEEALAEHRARVKLLPSLNGGPQGTRSLTEALADGRAAEICAGATGPLRHP
jgi:HNH endonuclease